MISLKPASSLRFGRADIWSRWICSCIFLWFWLPSSCCNSWSSQTISVSGYISNCYFRVFYGIFWNIMVFFLVFDGIFWYFLVFYYAILFYYDILWILLNFLDIMGFYGVSYNSMLWNTAIKEKSNWKET